MPIRAVAHESDIDGTRITDCGLDHLKTLPAISEVVVPHKCTVAQLKQMQARFPGIKLESPD